ncbi:hypothetical protein FRB97_003775 [Tulasnella sp. 331]|nr:hypothetical protein FRB97_003775 [Tulasnella sp. 331]
MSEEVPKDIAGPFVLIVIITAKPGKADEVAKHLSKVRAHAESDKEPDCLTFRPCRGYGGNPDSFAIFEKYMSMEAFELHRKSPPAIAFKASECCTFDKHEYFDEIGASET